MKFDVFRAYAAATATRKGVQVNEETLTAHRVPIEYPVEDVAFEGEADKGGETASFDAGDREITRVVFYAVSEDADGENVETVVGAIDVNASGFIEVSCPEPEPAPDPTRIV